ncbi:MAG TPA: T9SS type A sorting domain-containing protein [Ignavibacteriaceae bacterium]|nr:T9SS type A sorting domain-containing protein [Ignavibacteriaceae bacterium]
MKKLKIIFSILILFQLSVSAQELDKIYNLKFGSNFRIFPSTISQTEVFIVPHPLNENIMFSSANTWNQSDFFISEGVYVTTDGGLNWFGSDTCKGEPIYFHGGDPGIVIDKNGRFILTRLSGITGGGLFSHYSDDLGQSWSFQKGVAVGELLERATVDSDVNSANNFYGRTYAVWVKFSQPYPVVISFSDDGAENWSLPSQINNPSERGAGGEIKISPNGTVYVCWAAVINISPFTETFIGFGTSTDGGTTWIIQENAFDINGINGQLTNKGNIRVNGLPRMAIDMSGGSRHGWIYIVTTQKNLAPAGNDPDVILNKSTDGGISWSSGIRVNHDPLNNGAVQYFPAIHVDNYGGVNVIFYDDRNTTQDSTGVFLARSDDGGNTWREFEISDHNFKPVPLAGLSQGYQGDNIDLTSANEKLWPVWMDNSTGRYQIWTVPIEISSVSADEPSVQAPVEFELKQNYPNPFNPSTNISFTINEPGFVTLKIYDLLGNEITTLVNEQLETGEYNIEFNAETSSKRFLNSGIYFYTISHNGKNETKQMVLLK